jgi:hypothetical protein
MRGYRCFLSSQPDFSGCLFAKLRSFARAEMNTNSLEVVTLWNSRRDSCSVIVSLLKDIEELASRFTSFVIHHVRSHANDPTHLCAKKSCTLEMKECWMDSPHVFWSQALWLTWPVPFRTNKALQFPTKKFVDQEQVSTSMSNSLKIHEPFPRPIRPKKLPQWLASPH